MESRFVGIPWPTLWFIYNLPTFLHDQTTNFWGWYKSMMLIPDNIDPVGLALIIIAVLVFFRPELVKVWKHIRPVKDFYGHANPITMHIGLSKATGSTVPPPWYVRVKNRIKRLFG